MSVHIEKDVNKSFTVFDLIYQLILNNETIQPIIHKKSKSPKMNNKKMSFWCVYNEWDFFFFSMCNKMCLMYVVYWKMRAYSKKNSFIYKLSPFKLRFFLWRLFTHPDNPPVLN